MKIYLEYPWLFAILLPVILFCILFGRKLRMHHRPAKIRRILLRVMVMVFLILGVAGVTITMHQKKSATIFLVDVSESMMSQKEKVEEMLGDAMGNQPEDELTGIVAFGYDSSVEKFVSQKNTFSELQTTPVKTATNMEQAIAAALSLYPEGYGKRLVLITDGKQNAGDVSRMEQTLKTNDVVFGVMKLSEDNRNEVYISDLIIPERIKTGDTFQVQVEVESTVAENATLYLYAGETLKAKEEISLQTGTNQYVFKDTRNEEGYLTYRAVIEAADDNLLENNEYVAYTNAKDEGTVLVIEGEEGNAQEFGKVLKAANVAYDVIEAGWAPKNLPDMCRYDCLILVNVYIDDLPEGFLNNIESYVSDYAGGLIVTGGDRSFALGGYKDTVLEKILPVDMELTGENEIPKMAVVMVIDNSGSMLDNLGSEKKLNLAKEAAISSLKNFRDTDEIGVLRFDDTYNWVTKLDDGADKDTIEEKIRNIPDGGGTSIYPALKEAEKALECSDAQIKHIILLTDGQDGNQDYEGLARRIVANEVTLSTVAVGRDADIQLMQRLAELCEGRSYVTDGDSDLPRIFAQEIFLSSRAYLVNREFTPVMVNGEEILGDVADNGLPEMSGYIASTKKDYATSYLVSDDHEPVLTGWQYGLGKTVAFNSDVENIWTASYGIWDNYPSMWRNIIDWCDTELDDEESSLVITRQDNTVHVTYKIKEYEEDTKVSVISTGESGEEKKMALDITAPGVYEGDLNYVDTGVYSLNVREEANGELVRSRNTAVAVQYCAEYRTAAGTKEFDQFVSDSSAVILEELSAVYSLETPVLNQGKRLDMWFLMMAFILFVWDVVSRRLEISLADFLSRIPKRKKVLRDLHMRQQENALSSPEDMRPGAKHKEPMQHDEKSDQVQQESKNSGNAVSHNDSTESLQKEKGKPESKKEKKVKKQKEEERLDIASLLDSKEKRKQKF